ncbi:hypothetical protein [Nocardia iowensis]|uniref:Uncharacterized protein n=1 Tax=Nocardia iowensis TaxID=204891 RepID=A0ABX8RHR6_NOCIO|nr:hypothetical protein [Nocardia iowensis]QXN88851.1 hypothetical protein KV110_25095 [Nocardia iowensis]
MNESLPVFFDRKFKPWRYSVSHSELEIRSVGRNSDSDFIVLKFHNVIAMKLKTHYDPLTLAIADESQAEDILRFADLPESDWNRVKCLALKSDGEDSLVACVGYTMRTHSRRDE